MFLGLIESVRRDDLIRFGLARPRLADEMPS